MLAVDINVAGLNKLFFPNSGVAALLFLSNQSKYILSISLEIPAFYFPPVTY
jgi:hypothetical protein